MTIVPGSTMAMRVTAEPFSGSDVVERIDALIAADPDSVALRFARACALHDFFRNTEAERAYLDVLAREPEHFGALSNLGTLLHVAGRREIARALYTKAAVSHPGEPLAYVNLGNALAEDGEIDAAIATYERALVVSPDYPNAHFALALLYRGLERNDDALRHHQLAFARPSVTVAPALGTTAPLDVLVLVAAVGGNIVHAPLIERNAVRTYTLTVEGYRPEMVLPAHHVVFNAVGDADRSAAALELAAAVVEHSGAPLINDPAKVRATGRTAITQRLAGIPGVVTAPTRLFARADVTPEGLAAAGYAFPLLLRSPGFHTGQHFSIVPSTDALAAARDALPGKALLAIGFLDGRGPGGTFRKYRVMFIDGKLYPLHLAIAPQWKVHYFSADMTDRPDHREEEAAFLADMHGVLGANVVAALERIAATLGLDYGGIDFGIDAAGNVLVYEANATMVILQPPPDERFAYRRPAIERALTAAHAMIRARGERAGYVSA